MRGGYIILDLKGTVLESGTASEIEGAYKTASNPYGKATMVSGLSVGGVNYPEFYAPFIVTSDAAEVAVVIGGKTVTISVAEDDKVTVTVA